jgi:hypothetical protein
VCPCGRRLRFLTTRVIAGAKPANSPHKLTKTAEPWLGGGAAFGRLRTARGRHVGCTSLPPLRISRGSRRAARGGRRGGRFLQLRVSTLARLRDCTGGEISPHCFREQPRGPRRWLDRWVGASFSRSLGSRYFLTYELAPFVTLTPLMVSPVLPLMACGA